MNMEYPKDNAGKIQYIADHYGLKEQLAQTQEECAELIQAISKFNRAKTAEEHFSGQMKITEEMADVTIMLAQLEYLLHSHSEVGYNIQRKLDRQIERIQEELNGDTGR